MQDVTCKEREEKDSEKEKSGSLLSVSADKRRSSRKGDINVWACLMTFYAPMIYTALCVMLLMRAASITWVRNSRARNSRFPGPNPLPIAQVMDAASIEGITQGAV